MTEDPIPPPRMALLKPPLDADAVSLLDWYAAAILIAKGGASSLDIFDKAAAMVAESHRRKGFVP
jgi:hypothetical protein